MAMLDKFSLEIIHHLLEFLPFSDAEVGHVLLEESLLTINIIFMLNDLLSDGKLFGIGPLSMQGKKPFTMASALVFG